MSVFLGGIMLLAATILFVIIFNLPRILKEKRLNAVWMRERKRLKERYPYAVDETFAPIFTKKSECCNAMLWMQVPDRQFYCEECGRAYDYKFEFKSHYPSLAVQNKTIGEMIKNHPKNKK